MRKTALILALFALQACTGDSSLPTPTGKGTIRAINTIEGSPQIGFLIEERQLENVAYKNASAAQRFDDFEYNFNFEVFVLGDTTTRRVATVVQKIDANRDYTFVISGELLTPTITVIEGDERTFDEADTNFEVRFANVSESLGTVDVYFDAPGVAPVMGNQRGTISAGDFLPAMDFAEGDYVLTLTAENDPSTVLYQTDTVAYSARLSQILSVFDGDALDVSPFSVRLINAQAGVATLPDVNTQPTVRFIHAAIGLAPSDVYDDEMLTSLVLPNHQFGDITGDISVPSGVSTYTYTAVGNTGAIQFEGGIDAFPGTHQNFIVIGDMDNRVATTYVPDRRSISTLVRVTFFHTALNFEDLDLYIVDEGTPIDDDLTRTFPLDYSLITPTLTFVDGSYDIYVTERDSTTIVAGPLTINAARGDYFEFLILDTADPAAVEIRQVPAP